MNEQIQQLAKEAGLLFQRDKLSYEDQKFAELIVKECADLVDTLNEAYDAPSTAGKFIKEHFGVEQ